MEVLGERPFGMNETMTEYLAEMRQRRKDDEIDAAKTKLEEDLEDKSDDDEKPKEDDK